MPPSKDVPRGCAVFIRLMRKLANYLDGVDVTDVHPGDIIDVAEADAASLIAEGWAERVRENSLKTARSVTPQKTYRSRE